MTRRPLWGNRWGEPDPDILDQRTDTMKLHIEAITTTGHAGTTELTDDDVEAYQALETDAERTDWLDDLAREAVYDRDHAGPTTIVSLDVRLEET